MNKKPVIGFFALIYDPPLGGAERSMHNYLSQMTDRYEIHVTCFINDNRKFYQKEEFYKDGIHITRSPHPVDMSVRAFINNHNPDLIATQLLASDLVVNEAYKHNIPCVYFAHGIFEDVCPGYIRPDCPYDNVLQCPHTTDCKYYEDIQRHLDKYKKCSHIICNSGYTKKVFEKIFPDVSDKLSLVYPNFNYDLFKYQEFVNNSKVTCLAVNSSVLKGRNLIGEIALRNPDIEFIYVDTRGQDYTYLSRCPNIKLFAKISREELAQLYREVDVTLIPTILLETFSGVACESILSGTPVICTNKGNLSNLMEEGETGFILEHLDQNIWLQKIREAAKFRVPKYYSDTLREVLSDKCHLNNIVKVFDKFIFQGKIKRKVNNYDQEDLSDINNRVIFFARFYYPPLGGGEYFISSILNHLKDKGFSCKAACYCHPDPRQRFFDGVTNWRGIEVRQFGSMSYEVMLNYFKQERPALVITQSYDAPDIVKAAKSLGIKTILGTHFWRNICEVPDDFVNMLERSFAGVKVRKDLHRVFHEADGLYVNSEYMKKAVKRFVGIDIDRVICPTLDRTRVVSSKRDPKYITLVNSDYGKGGKLFLELAKTLPDRKFRCLGLGNDSFQKNSLINEEMRQIPNIEILEKTDEISKIYEECSILLVPSILDETFSMVCLEAMANGIPVLVSHYGNLPYLVGQDNGCYILDPMDSFVWKECIEYLLGEEKIYLEHSQKAKRRSEKFAPEDQMYKFYELVLECLGCLEE